MIRESIYQSHKVPLQRFFLCLALLALVSLIVMFKQSEIVAHVIGAKRRIGMKISLERREDRRIESGHNKSASDQELRNKTKTKVLSRSAVRSYNYVKDLYSSNQTVPWSSSSPSLSLPSLPPSKKSSLLLPFSSLVSSSLLSSPTSYPSSTPPLPSSKSSSAASSSLRSAPHACSYEGLKKKQRLYESDMSCVPHPHTDRDCNKAFNYFGNYSLESEAPKCGKKTVTESVCTFVTKHRLSPADRVYVKCKRNICNRKSPVYLGCQDPDYGTLKNTTQWLKFHSIRKLEHELPSIVARISKHGFTFCFIRCKRSETEVTQGLFFPPVIKRQSKQSLEAGSKVNINILLEDSISRLQFYRYLPKTVRVLREIATDSNSKATVLDFELVQSYASSTLPNLQRLMAGTKYQGQSRNNGIEVLAQKYKSLGYQTLFHEDLCWYDYWGSLLSPTYKQKLQHFTGEFRQAYAKYIESTELHIDNSGMSSFACEVLRSLGHTNPFHGDQLPELCWNGRFLSDYVLAYVRSFLSAIERNPGVAAPALVYTHLNTAHESTGVRVRNDDGVLSQFITEMAQSKNTLTIVLSDHGAKTNDYAIKSLAGSLEVYSPMLFMIIPEDVAHKLGKKRMDALLANQRRLVSVLDLHRMLMSLGDLRDSVAADENHQVSGLLAPVPLNRTCADMEGLSSDAMCRCRGWHKFLDGSSPVVAWLAEYALGELNNMIQKQYTESTKGQRQSRGYGACARFVGKRVERPRRELVGKKYVITLVLVVVPEYGADSTERFEVQLKYAPVRKHNITFVKFTRLSFYSKYEPCVDDGVDIKLCACAVDESPKPLNIKSLIRSKNFNHETTVQPLDSQSCLFLVIRMKNTEVVSKIQTRVLAFEVTNVCEHSKFTLGVRGIYKLARISRALPFTVHVKPTRVHFLFSVLNAWKFGRFRPVITVQRFPIARERMTPRARSASATSRAVTRKLENRINRLKTELIESKLERER